jgi:hypothetical protein
MIERMKYEKFLDWYYNKGGMHTILYGTDSVSGVIPSGEKIAKAIGPWDAPTSPYTTYFEPVYSATVQMWVARNTEIYKLLRKTTWLAEGDSLKFVETDLAGLVGISGSSTPFASGSAESAPTVVELTPLYPAHLLDPWETALPSRTYATYQNAPKLDPAWNRTYHAELLPHQIDMQLCKTVDTVANDGSSNLNLESIDRILSGSAEAATTYCNAAADPDLYWGNSSALVDRSADTDDTYGPGDGDGISLPSLTAARVLSLDLIDDVMAGSIRYSKNKRYIGVTGPKTINEMQKLIDPKQRFLEAPMNVQYTINGVSTRAGVDTGFTVASYTSNGVKIPFFSSSNVANETSANRSATVTDADIGNIYIMDLDEIEIREAIPVTYLETPPESMLTGDVMKIRHAFLYSAQLLATNFRSHAVVKYLKST